MEAPIYNQEGKEAGKIKLPEQVFNVPWNADLVHQVVISMQANARTPVAHTKNRGEVRGGGRKPWRQKGTGRARHGSRRSPIWRGGGITHGPRNEKSYAKKVNTKMRARALFSVLSKKWKDNEILFVEALNFNEPKTKLAKEALGKWSTLKGFESLDPKKRNAALIALGERGDAVIKSFRNIGNISLGETRNLNPVDVLANRYLVVVDPEESIKVLESRTQKKIKSVEPKAKRSAKNPASGA